MAELATEGTTETVFTTADRCDACGAQAWVRAHMRTGVLLFCAHHAREFSGALAQAERVEDGRDSLYAPERA